MAEQVQVRLTLDAETWRRARAMAVLEGISASYMVEQFLRNMTGNVEGSSGSADLDRPGAVGEGAAQVVRYEDDGEQDRGGGAGGVSRPG